MKKKIKRQLDPRTMTYSFSDGSGQITQEQKIERELLRTAIQTEECGTNLQSSWKDKIKLANLKIRYLTFFSK